MWPFMLSIVITLSTTFAPFTARAQLSGNNSLTMSKECLALGLFVFFLVSHFIPAGSSSSKAANPQTSSDLSLILGLWLIWLKYSKAFKLQYPVTGLGLTSDAAGC